MSKKVSKIFSIENLILIGVLAGIFAGIFCPNFSQKIKIIGDIFLALLKMIIVPLVFTSVLVAVLELEDLARFGGLGIKTLVYYLFSTGLSVITGLVLVSVIAPGKDQVIGNLVQKHVAVKNISLENLIWSLIPVNPVVSFVKAKVLQIIFFSILLGLSAISLSKEKLKIFYSFFDTLNDALIVLTRWIIALTPVGVFSLVSFSVAKFGINVMLSLWKYALTVILGLLIHAFLNLPLLGFIFGRYNAYRYFFQVKDALVLAFSTASSAATLPVSLKVSQEKGGVKKSVAGFILPLGATINMDGTALYEAVAAVFIANLFGIKLGFLQMVTIFLTATLASIGAAAIPGAGLVMLTLVLNSVGLPLQGIGIIIVIDRFLDMLRTSVNVWSDLNGAKILTYQVKT
jgi:Na+/H+-dicarboxylate symporter